ncbi:basic helix-loop-helix (bHLH) DNA-bindingsuperfamily protein [Striga asiatica]|uniref:Basic helix-loop-helix (BHLH) DNA-bindingsuperfamily protein n=1 Tax=Striga asiatica TaxID=4170 RepID=A0A5A7PV12_STRAF|nr:basic helix-loop-helix (bHLH) DNA-bindingsuperfamily protein [Striga asiatica]
METSSFRSLPDLGVDDALFSQSHQWPANNSHVELSTESIASLIYENFQHSFSQQQPVLDFKRAAESPGPWPNRQPKQLKPTSNWDSCKAENMFISDSNLSINPSLGMVKPKEETMWSSYYNTTNPPCESIASFGNQDYFTKPGKRVISTPNTRMAQTPQDHILAERKRREKISQRFIALSALVPGLKKMDKASVLGDAVKYLKQLQEKIKVLEEQTKKKSTEKLVFVKKYEICADGESCCTEENFSGFAPAATEPLPEIQARFCDKDVLIIINCEKRKGVLEKAVAEIEKLNLSVVNSCVMAFGDSAINITLLAKKEERFDLNMKELTNNLSSALKLFM